MKIRAKYVHWNSQNFSSMLSKKCVFIQKCVMYSVNGKSSLEKLVLYLEGLWPMDHYLYYLYLIVLMYLMYLIAWERECYWNAANLLFPNKLSGRGKLDQDVSKYYQRGWWKLRMIIVKLWLKILNI